MTDEGDGWTEWVAFVRADDPSVSGFIRFRGHEYEERLNGDDHA